MDGSDTALHPLVGSYAVVLGEDLVVELRERPALDVRCRQRRNRPELVSYTDHSLQLSTFRDNGRRNHGTDVRMILCVKWSRFY